MNHEYQDSNDSASTPEREKLGAHNMESSIQTSLGFKGKLLRVQQPRALMLPMNVVRCLSACHSATTVTWATKTKLTNWIAGK